MTNKEEILGNFAEKLVSSQEDIPPEFTKVLNEEFWDLVSNEENDMSDFLKELEDLINRHCMENESNTPDYLLAEYLCGCMKVFATTTAARDKWWGNKNSIVDRCESSELTHIDSKSKRMTSIEIKDQLIHTLLAQIVELLGTKSELLSVVNSQNDTLDDEEVLSMLRAWLDSYRGNRRKNEFSPVYNTDAKRLIAEKVSVEEIDGHTLVLQKIYNSAVLRTAEGNEFAICMRDDTFEMTVIGSDKWYRANIEEGTIEEL